MPRGNKLQDKISLMKLLLVGEGKGGKTHYAGMAAAAGFHTLYFDGDVAEATLRDLPEQALRNLYVLDVGDRSFGGSLDCRFSQLFASILSRPRVVWNDSKGELFNLLKPQGTESDEIWDLYPAKMDENCLLVIDSWTSLSQSTMQWAAMELNVDLSEPIRGKMRDVYQMAGEKLTQFAAILRSAPCHVIVIAHPNEYTKMKPPSGRRVSDVKEKDMEIDFTKLLPKSSSNNHALSMAKYFTDIGWMTVDAMGKRIIDFTTRESHMSGSHFDSKMDVNKEGAFKELLLGGASVSPNPDAIANFLTIYEGGFVYETPEKKASLVLGSDKEKSTPDSPVAAKPKPILFGDKK